MYINNLAILDIGSNTIRLAIYGIDHQYNFVEIQNIKTPARLSQYIEEDKSGQYMMTEDGVQVLLQAVKSFKAVADKFQVEEIIAVATAAIRQSANQAEILQRVFQETGVEIRLISGEEEATYGQYAITHSTSINDAVTVDIGGGSCEVTLYHDKTMVASHSFPFGAVSLSRQFFQGKDHNDPEAMKALSKYVRKEFKSQDWLKKANLDIVAIGGSARNVAYVHQRSLSYPMGGLHGYQMRPNEIEETLEIFKQTPLHHMENIDGLSTDRIDIIIPATLVFVELMNVVASEYFCLSTQGLREGIVLKYINNNYNYPLDSDLIRVRSIRQIVRDFPINTIGSQIQVDLAISLYRQLCDLGLFEYDYEIQEELEFAAYLYRFGGFIGEEADSQHTFYLLSNMSLLGFSHRKRLRLSLLSSFRNRSLYRQFLDDYEGWLSDDEMKELELLGSLLKFSTALNDSKTGPINHLALRRDDKHHYHLDIQHEGIAVAEKYRVARHRKHFERILDGDLTIQFNPVQV